MSARYADPRATNGWAAALHDPAIMAALQAMHRDPCTALDGRDARRRGGSVPCAIRSTLHRHRWQATAQLSDVVADDNRGPAASRVRRAPERHRTQRSATCRNSPSPAHSNVNTEPPPAGTAAPHDISDTSGAAPRAASTRPPESAVSKTDGPWAIRGHDDERRLHPLQYNGFHPIPRRPPKAGGAISGSRTRGPSPMWGNFLPRRPLLVLDPPPAVRARENNRLRHLRLCRPDQWA